MMGAKNNCQKEINSFELKKLLLSDMYSEKVGFVRTYKLGLCMEQQEKVDQKPGMR